MAATSNLDSVRGKFSDLASQAQRRAGHFGATAGLDSAILNALPAQVALIDREGIIRLVNEAWRDHSAGQPDTRLAVGGSYLEFCENAAGDKPERSALVVAGVRAVLAGEQDTFVLEYPAAGERWFRVIVTPFQESGFAGAVVMRVDITGQKATEALRDDDLQRQKLEAVGRLSSGVAHDFANLLTLISGYSEILLNRLTALDPLRPELEEIRKAANRGAGMTAQLLDFVRSQSVEPRILDLHQVALDVEKMLRSIIGEHIELAVRVHGSPGKVKADPAQMTRVIMNLVLNARDAMPLGGRVLIETAALHLDARAAREHDLAPGSYVTLSVTDTGQGMSPETLSQAFRPFFTTKARGRGTGLGLSTVYSIVRQSNGGVWARSELDRGTTFTICLPRVEQAAEPAQSAGAIAPGLGSGNETILLVEDEDGVRRLLKHILASRGYQVLEAGDGQHALDVYAAHDGPVHLLLTDIVMPRMNGTELAQQMLARQPGLRVIYISGYTDDVLARTGALGAGMSFLQKPIKPDALASRVREVLDAPARAGARSGE